MKQQDLGRNLESIDQKLAPYSRPHAQKRFYAAASAAARIMQQNLTTINQLWAGMKRGVGHVMSMDAAQ